MADFDIAIAGAGIVGTSTALWAQMRGHKVLLADPNPPGSGTSSGNACTIATYACLPVNDPSVLFGLPRLLFSKDSPLSISYSHALKNPRWMLSFLANCSAKRSREISRNLAGLLAHADSGLNPLIVAAEAEDLVVENGQLSVWSSKAGAKAAEAGLKQRRSHGVHLVELTADEATSMEPGLKLPIERAVFYPEARHIRDPEQLIRRMHARFTDLGGRTIAAKVSKVTARASGVELKVGDNTVHAGHVVVASGAFSRQIAGAETERLPLGTERGYHIVYANDAHRITRPVGWSEGGFYAVPMAKGLRLAGTVEIDHLNKPVNQNRISYLVRRATEMFGPLPVPDSHWLGYRPTMPDSLPVIGHTAKSKRIIHAFAHQHLGLTLGGITGRIVTDLAEGRHPNIDIAAFRPDRSYTVA